METQTFPGQGNSTHVSTKQIETLLRIIQQGILTVAQGKQSFCSFNDYNNSSNQQAICVQMQVLQKLTCR